MRSPERQEDASQRQQRATPGASGLRSWTTSVVWALLAVGGGVLLSAVVNPAIGRRVHWDWTTGLAVALFFVLLTAIRRRWL